MLTVVYEQGMFEGETRPFSGHRIVVQGQQVKKKQEEVLGHRRLSCQNQREQSMTHTNLIYGRRVLGNYTSYKAACVSYRTATYASISTDNLTNVMLHCTVSYTLKIGEMSYCLKIRLALWEWGQRRTTVSTTNQILSSVLQAYQLTSNNSPVCLKLARVLPL